MSQKISFWLSFCKFQDCIKNRNICSLLPCNRSLVEYLYICNWTSFWGVMTEKPSRSSPNLYFLLLRKLLKIHTLTTTNAILMKLTTIMYLNETFYLTKNWGVTHRT